MRYAEKTSVSVEKSKGEIERVLTRYGATEFLSGWKAGQAVIGFRMNDRMLRFVLPMPDKEEFRRTDGGKGRRSDDGTMAAWEQAQRQKYRALNLIIKAKLESIAAGVETFEQAFLAEILIASGQTVSEWVIPKIAESYASGKTPQLSLPAPKR